MELYDMLHPMLELSISIPAIILCFLPMKNHLNGKGKLLLLWGIPTLILWCVGAGWLCWRLRYSTKLCMLLTQVLLLLFYCKAVPLSRWKTVNVFLAVCGVFSCMYNLAILIDALLFRRSGAVVLSLNSTILYVLLCWLLLGILCYPATHAARWLLDEVETPETWYIFWILPLVFWYLNTTLRPRKYSTLYTNRVMHFYPILILALLGLMLLYYALFYWMARGIAKNIRLSQENKLLQMQTAQYRTLQKSIADTRRARHDLHQHFKALQGCVESGDISKVAAYVKAYGESLPPDTIHPFCKNYAVDAILHHYAEQALLQKTDLEAVVQMEEQTIIPEPEFCSLLGNLLENALDACAASKTPRFIRLHIRQQGSLYLTMDNTSDQPPLSDEKRLISSKHDGFGIGTESVRMTAERYNGDARFEWREGVFYASVMLSSAD